MGRTIQEAGTICAEHQFGTRRTHSRNRGNQASLGGGGRAVGRGGKASDNGQRVLFDRAVVSLTLMHTHALRGKNKHTNTHTHTKI